MTAATPRARHEDVPHELRELSGGVYAYLQRGSWGMSNAGFVTSAGASLLVDTLYDLALTARMLETLRGATAGAERIGSVINTHANGDHCWGNQLVSSSEIISSRATAEEMRELSPNTMATLLTACRSIADLGALPRSLLRLLGKLGVPRVAALEAGAEFALSCFGRFEFRGITLTLPTRTFDGQLTLHVGDKRVELFEVGPAHTKGDTLVYVPDDRVVFTGDILFIDSHPIMWEGPVERWIAACDRLLALDVDTIVPGHGPVTDKQGVQRIKDYWLVLSSLVAEGRKAGARTEDIAGEALAKAPSHWGESHRVIANVDHLVRTLADDDRPRDPVSVIALMARFA